MKTSRLVIALTAPIALAMLSSAGSAQTREQVEARYSKDFNECSDASGGVTVELMNCGGLEIAAQDGRLNQAYKMKMARLKTSDKIVLRNSQRKWIKDRDAKCKGVAWGGSSAGLEFQSCFLFETVKRTMWLENYRPRR